MNQKQTLTDAAKQALACMRGLQQHLGPDICAVEADALERALTQPAQPAEGGEAWAKTASELNHFAHTGKWPEDSTAPPASQEQALTVIDPEEWEPCTPEYLSNGGDCKAPRVWHAATCNHWHPKREPRQEQAQQPSEPNCDRSACGDFSPGPCDHPDCHALRKQQPSGVEVVDFEAACIGYARLDGDEYKLASMRRSPLMADGQLHPIYAFPDELVERHHQQLQSFATPKPEPMTDDQLLTLAARHLGEMHVENCGLGDIKEFARAVEAHHGITKEQAWG